MTIQINKLNEDMKFLFKRFKKKRINKHILFISSIVPKKNPQKKQNVIKLNQYLF